MKIRKQIRFLYLYEIVSGLQIVDLVWVLLLLQRGFSLAEAGIAEGVFHLVSMCCEIPSGMAADLMGRKKTMVLAGMISALSSVCMIATDFFPMILLSMGLNALSYNLVSGSREALTYDSLKEAGMEQQYLRIASRQEMIYQILCAVTGLISVLTVRMGFRAAYLLAAVQGMACAGIAARLWEAGERKTEEWRKSVFRTVCCEVIRHFQISFRFLREHPSIRCRMAAGGGMGAVGYLISMLLQEYLVTLGLSEDLVGIPLFFLSLSGVAGAFLSERTGKRTCGTVVLAGGLTAAAAAAFCGSGSLFAVVAAASGVQCMDEMICLRLENENQKETDSEIRATVVSVGSMVYSIWMAVLSPVCGYAARILSVPAAFAGLGGLMAGLAVWYAVCGNRAERKLHPESGENQ